MHLVSNVVFIMKTIDWLTRVYFNQVCFPVGLLLALFVSMTFVIGQLWYKKLPYLNSKPCLFVGLFHLLDCGITAINKLHWRIK